MNLFDGILGFVGILLILFVIISTKVLTVNIQVNGKILNTFLLSLRTRQKCLLSPLIFNTLPEVLANAISQEKETKEDWKNSCKALIFCRLHEYV